MTYLPQTARGIDILQAITWVADAWKDVSVETIKNCFAKCGITPITIIGRTKLSCRHERQIRENKSARQKAKLY